MARTDIFTGITSGPFDPAKIGRAVVEQFLSTVPESYAPEGYDGGEACGGGQFVMYAVVSLWLNALQFAAKCGDRSLTGRLISRFEPFFSEKKAVCSVDNHVDFSVFGTVPLEIYIQNKDSRALALGLHYADNQWAKPNPLNPGGTGNADFETQLSYLEKGWSPQARFWIEDMYMITVLQVQAFRATGDRKYIERTANLMKEYLDRMQLPNGLFNHSSTAPHLWGRGNGWVSGGMPLLLENLPDNNPNFRKILDSYKKMASALIEYQHESGLWGQIIDNRDAWDESSCSGMFASSLIKGVKNGWLDPAEYSEAASRAYFALCSRMDSLGNLSGTGAGINCSADPNDYLASPRINGAPHGQAALLWAVNALIN